MTIWIDVVFLYDSLILGNEMIKWFWAKITGGKLVWLKDYDGEITKSIAYESPFGGLIAQRLWPFKIRCVELLPDGTVKGGYVKNWRYVDKTNRTVS